MSHKKVVFLAQAEPFFIPAILETLINRLGSRLVAVGFFSTARSFKDFRREYLSRFFYYGPVDFARISFLFFLKRFSGRSPEAIAQKKGTTLVHWPGARLDDPQLLEEISAIKPDFLLVLGNQFVPQALRSLAESGCFNIHLASLPRHRGREPIFHALLAGDKRLGVTVHEMSDKLDQGKIYARAEIDAAGVTVLGAAQSLWMRGADLFCDMVLQSEKDVLSGTDQDESQANYNKFPTSKEVAAFRRAGGKFL